MCDIDNPCVEKTARRLYSARKKALMRRLSVCWMTACVTWRRLSKEIWAATCWPCPAAVRPEALAQEAPPFGS